MNSYTDQYFDAIIRSLALESGEEDLDVSGFTLESFRADTRQFQIGIGQREYTKIKRELSAFARYYLKNIPTQVAHSCHAISHGFRETWTPGKHGEQFPLTVTIGNVYFSGQNIYGATPKTVLDLIAAGPVAGEDLPVHVWLTLDDMTVLDLTILQSLPRLGFGNIQQDSPVLVWDERMTSHFDYEPLFIHNHFFNLVDSGRMAKVAF
jgi:hypothetical protein